MDLFVNNSVPVLTVFLQGLLSFFSPCILPLIPVYMGYLSGGTLKKDEEGNIHYDRVQVIVNTVFFTVGVSFAFLLLGLGMSAVGRFFSGNQMLFSRLGGIIVILFGLYQLGAFGVSKLLSAEVRLPFNMDKMTMSPITALIFGFVLSFAWSPCIGPILSSVLIMAASAKTSAIGFLLIGVYTLGYIIPFLLVGIFTTTLLNFFGKHKNVVRYTVKIGGVVLIIMGVLMLTGKMNGISSYLASISGTQSVENNTKISESNSAEDSDIAKNGSSTDESTESSDSNQSEVTPAADFTLTDQNGNTHTLSDYRGKIVFLNFWATWCPPCKAELPYIQELYDEYNEKPDSDVEFLTVTFPGLGHEHDVDGVKNYIDNNGFTFPVLMDSEFSLIDPYYISAYPTTFIIDPEGNILGYIPGGMTKDAMEDVLNQAREMTADK